MSICYDGFKTKKPVQKDRFSLQGGMVAVVYRLAYCQTGAMVVPVFVFYFLSTDAKPFVHYIISRYKAITPITNPTASSTFFSVLLISIDFLKCLAIQYK